MGVVSDVPHEAWETPKRLELGEVGLKLVDDDSQSALDKIPLRSYTWLKPALLIFSFLVATRLLLASTAVPPRTVIQAPAFLSRGELVLKRLASMNEHRRAPIKYIDKSDRPPGVALVFLTIRGVRHRTLWQRWFEDAYAWLEEQGIEAKHEGGNGTNHRSNVIRAYVHHPHWLDPNLKLESVPPALRPGVIEDPVDCSWWIINGCFHRGLKEAVEKFEEAEWFYTVASDAVPLKTFAEMYTNLLDDSRPRIEFARLVYEKRMPKASNWVMFTRPYAATLVANPEKWTNGTYHIAEETQWAAGADEWAVYRPLLDEFGEEFFAGQHPGVFTIDPEARPFHDAVNTFACWGGCEEFGESEGHLPPLFHTIKHNGLARLRSSATITHARKFNLESSVDGCPVRRKVVTAMGADNSLQNLVWLKRTNIQPQKRMTAGRGRSGKLGEAGGWSAANFGPYHSNQKCGITDFLSWRLNLKSSAQEEEEKEPLTLLPKGYQSLSSVESLHRALVKAKTFGVRADIVDKYSS